MSDSPEEEPRTEAGRSRQARYIEGSLFGWQPVEVNWTGEQADPLGDIRKWQKAIANQCGTRPTTLIMSSAQTVAYERFTIWFEETIKRLSAIPRRHYIARRVLEKQLYGYPTSTSVRRFILLRFRQARIGFSRRYWRLRSKIGQN